MRQTEKGDDKSTLEAKVEITTMSEAVQQPKFIEPIKLEDVGLGAFYFFASFAIIRVMNYAGYGRSVDELSTFFFCMLSSMVIVHLFSSQLLRLRDLLSECYDWPLFSIFGVLAIVAVCLSMLPYYSLAFFYSSAVLTGISCSFLIISWTSTLSLVKLRASSFCILPSLITAFAFYFCYRLIGLFSALVADGYLIAVPLIGMVAMLVSYSPEYSSLHLEQSRSGSYKLLGLIAIIVALGSSLFVYFSGHPDSFSHAEFTLMIPLEFLGAVIIAAVCYSLYSLAVKQKRSSVAANTACFLILTPMFLLGCLTGLIDFPSGEFSYLWEASIWVVLVAVFAYDMRTSLYNIKGTTIGIMFEAWCVGQMLTKIHRFTPQSLVITVFLIALGALYFGSVMYQLLSKRSDLQQLQAEAKPETNNAIYINERKSRIQEQEEIKDTKSFSITYGLLGEEYNLTPREMEILSFVAEGRSAKFISEELVISYNTARSHIRHIYEKLDIHSKQELISLLKFIGKE